MWFIFGGTPFAFGDLVLGDLVVAASEIAGLDLSGLLDGRIFGDAPLPVNGCVEMLCTTAIVDSFPAYLC